MPRLSAHLLAPLAVALASLAIPFTAPSPGRSTVVVSATSVSMRVAQLGNDGTTGADQRYPVGSSQLQVARDIARAHWNADPCGGNVEFVWQVMDPETNATASWRNPTDAWNNIGENFDCKIELNTQAEFDWAKFCTVMTHEIGHLVGQQHAADPGQLMSPYYSDPLQACVDANPDAAAQQAAKPEPTAQIAANAQVVKKAAAAKKAAAKKKAAKKKTLKRSAKRRCVVRFQAGKRVKRCTTVTRATKHAARPRKLRR